MIETTIVPPRGRLTERELLEGARVVRELEKLRAIQPAPGGATLKLPGSYSGITEVSLSSADYQAVVALLIERHSTFLASLDVELEETPK